MSNVQPLTPYQPTINVLLAIDGSPQLPENPTNTVLSATTPPQNISTYSGIPQLPSYIVTSLVSQQAVTNNSYTTEQKIDKGILVGPTGATLSQLSSPGQSIKPGADALISSLQQAVPTMPLTLSISNALTTGFGGIASTENLVKNTNAQISAVTNAIQQSTTSLVNNNLLTGKEDPTQIAGVVMAAATLGVDTVSNALKDPLSIASKVGGIGNEIGNAIAGGTFAAGLADKVSSGLGGLTASLGGVVSGALGSLSSGITKFVKKIPSGLEALVSGISSQLQSAFNLAEKSFGEMKAGAENVLGGVAALPDPAPSKTLSLIRDMDKAQDELFAVEKELSQARKDYFYDTTEDNLQAIRTAEAKLSAAQQKLLQLAKQANDYADQVEGKTTQNNTSTQNISKLTESAISGAINAPKTLNTGINSIPGGLGAFTSVIGNATSNMLGSLKNAADKITSNVPAALAAISNPTKLVGNLVANLQQSISSIAGNINRNLNDLVGGLSDALGSATKAADGITGAISGATTAVNALASNAVANASGIMSNIKSSIASLGNAPGQLKAAIVATETFKETKVVMNSVLTKVMDAKVPPPIFEEVQPSFEPDTTQRAQVDAQLVLEELMASRESKSYELDSIITVYLENQQPALIFEIENLRNEIANIDKQIQLAQVSYDKLISSQ